MSHIAMRAKFVIREVINHAESQVLVFGAVSKSTSYPANGTDEDNTFARWTPNAYLSMTINNPELLGKFQVGEKFYLDFRKVEPAE